MKPLHGKLQLDRVQLIAIGLFLFSWLLRIVFHQSAVMVEPAVRSDALKYLVTAINLVDSGVYSYDMKPPLQSSTLLVPGYPWFLSLIYATTGDVGATVSTAFQLQIIMSALIPALVFLICRRYLEDWQAAVPAIVVALYPHQIIMGSYLLTESLFSFLTVLAMYIFLLAVEQNRIRHWLALALTLSFATLTRPILFLLPALLMVVFFRRHLLKQLTWVLACVVVTYGAWGVWGKTVADKNESNFRSVVALGTYPDFTYKHLRGYPYREDPDFPEMRKDWDGLARHLVERARREPLKYMGWYLVGKPASLWSFNNVQGAGGPYIYPVQSSIFDYPGIFKWAYGLIASIHPVLVFSAVLYGGYLVFNAMFRPRVRQPFALEVMAILLIYSTVFHIPLASLPRFSIPFQAAMAIVSCTLFMEAYNHFWRSTRDVAVGDTRS